MNIFIANLSFRVQSEDLEQLFQEYGQVSSAKVVFDRETGKSRGFGFVEMSNDEEALKAIEELNEAEYDGNVIVVKKAKPKEELADGKGGGNRGFKKPGGFGGGGNRRFDNNGGGNRRFDNGGNKGGRRFDGNSGGGNRRPRTEA